MKAKISQYKDDIARIEASLKRPFMTLDEIRERLERCVLATKHTSNTDNAR